MKAPKLDIRISKRFEESYDAAGIVLKNLAEVKVHYFVRRYRQDPRSILQQYPRLATLPDVLEIDLAGGPRMLAHLDRGTLVLLEMGKHEIVPRYTRSKLAHDLCNLSRAPGQFYPENASIFVRALDLRDPIHFAEELFPSEWLYWLDEPQKKVLRKVRSRIKKGLSAGNKPAAPFFIVGGPGTGKTIILLHLLTDLWSHYSVRISISKPLARYIQKVTQLEILKFHTNYSSRLSSDLLLVDDPGSPYEICKWLNLYEENRARAIVLAFDPLQLRKDITDAEYASTV